MKFSLALAAIAISATNAFTSNLSNTHASSTKMMATKADVSPLIAEAMKISEKFGAQSVEARLAWETVEELNASDNSVASMGSLADECEVEAVSQECVEYGEALEELQELVAANAFPDESFFAKEIASTVSQVKLAAPETTSAPASAELKLALEEAREITASKGLTSPEAAVAWETVEEIASAGNVLGGALTKDECFVEAAKEACVALEELHKIVGDNQ